ncbi:MAG: hypothetical protein ACETWG_11635 [Candidatus Neomarinimicrobiota bacterium]
MQSRIILNTPLIKRMISALPGVDNGRVVINPGSPGTLTLIVNQLHIGQDEVQIPLQLHLGSSPDYRGIGTSLRLTNWHIRDGSLWFTLRQIGNLPGALFRPFQGALIKLLDGIVQQRYGNAVQLQQQDGQLGIPLAAFLDRWGNLYPPIRVTGIEVNDGVILHLG